MTGAKVTADGADGYYCGVDSVSGEAIVRTGKPNLLPPSQYHHARAFAKLKLTEVGSDGTHKLYRDKNGAFYEVKEHGSGFMTAPRPEYRAVKPEAVQRR